MAEIGWKCQFQDYKILYLRLITRNLVTALWTGFIPPGMRRAAVCTEPAFLLPCQPFHESVTPNHFHILQYASLIQPLCVIHKLPHLLAGIKFGALITEPKAFLDCAALDATGRAISCRLLTFASITSFGSHPCLGVQHYRAGTAIKTAISMQYKIHGHSSTSMRSTKICEPL